MSSNNSCSEFRRLVFGPLISGLVMSSVSCAHYDNESGTYSGSVFAPVAGQSRNADVVEGAIAGIAIIYEMGRVSGNSKSPQIFGVCQVRTNRGIASDSDKERCQETYISFRSSKDGHESKVWADSSGEFTFAMSPGVAYEVVAVNESLRASSKPIRISRPGRLNLQIEIETMSTVQPAAAKASSSKGSNHLNPEETSSPPPIDFGLKPKNEKGR